MALRVHPSPPHCSRPAGRLVLASGSCLRSRTDTPRCFTGGSRSRVGEGEPCMKGREHGPASPQALCALGKTPSCHGISSVPSSVESRWEELSAGHTIVPQSIPVLPPIPPPPNRGGSQVSRVWGRGWFSSGRAHLAPGKSTVLVPLPFFHPGQSQLRAVPVGDWAKSCTLMT